MNQDRRALLQEVFQAQGIGAFLMWRSDELVMSLEYQPLWGISLCLFPAKGVPILYVPQLEPKDRLPSDIVVKSFPWGTMDCPDPWKVLYGMVQKDLVALQISERPVSFVPHIGQSSPAIMSGEGAPLPFDFQEALMAISDGGYKDITAHFLKLYNLKNDREIEQISLANGIAAVGIRAFYENLVQGNTEVGVCSAVEMAVQNTVDDTKVFYAKAWPQVQSGTNAANGGMFNRTSGKELCDGELVMIEMGVCVNGYWADITRTGSVGSLESDKLAFFTVVQEAQMAAVAAIAPGRTTGEIDKIARRYIMDKGYGHYFQHPLGHPVGFRYHDPGPPLAPDGSAVLEVGMVYTVEPGIYGKELGGGARIEDNVLVTSDGYRVLSNFSRGLKWE
ncbi:MAG: Xaa-Pro peptidase family protein [Sediminicola sp.]